MRLAFSLLIGSIVAGAFGCAQTHTGTYTGNETVTLGTDVSNYQNLSNNQITLSLTQTNNDVISGNWQSTNGTGNFLIRPSGEASLSYTLNKCYSGTVCSNSALTSSISCGTYVGKLTLTTASISGRLDLTQAATVSPTVAATLNISDIRQVCPSFRTMSVTK